MSVVLLRGAKEAPRGERTKTETLLLTPEIVNQWTVPPFQRPLRVNDKVRQVAERLKTNGGVMSGILTLGMLPNDRNHYLLDGQHRREAALISEIPEFIADVRIMQFDTLAEMADEFVRLNTQIVRLRPDDVLRGLEGSIMALQVVRKGCSFVGYEMVRRGTHTPTLSMGTVIRCWAGSNNETPAVTGSGKSAQMLAEEMQVDQAESLVRFLNICRSAWGADMENARLWGTLNIALCMWLWRNLVLNKERKAKRMVVLSADQFKKCLMSLSASTDYLDWLVGRNLSDRDRSPCFIRMKHLMVKRVEADTGTKPIFPQPAWSSR